MTTIAYDGTTMASDSKAGVCHRYNYKIRKCKNGIVVGGAGDMDAVELVYRAIESEGKVVDVDMSLLKPEANLECIIVDGENVYRMFDTGIAIRHDAPLAAGSGAEIALGAMLAGANAEKAVEIAELYDEGTGGQVHSVIANANQVNKTSQS